MPPAGSLAPLNAELQSVLTEQFRRREIHQGKRWRRSRDRADRTAGWKARENQCSCQFHAGHDPEHPRSHRVDRPRGHSRAGGNSGWAWRAGNVVIVLALFGRLFPRITTVQAQLHHLSWNVHAIEVIDKLQAAAEAEAERQDARKMPLEDRSPATLTVRSVRVKFGERVVLDHINLTLPIPGVLAIVGRSGAGKSTLVHALLGLGGAEMQARSAWETMILHPRRFRPGAAPSVMYRRKRCCFMHRSETI